jgi:hypothetical protein
VQLSSHDSSAYLLSVPFVGYLITISVIEFIQLSKEHNSPILKREAGGPSETLVPIHQSTRNNILEDRILKLTIRLDGEMTGMVKKAIVLY